MKKLLMFGGAFNPPHLGHEKMLECAIELIKPELTVVIPTGTSPHKQSGEVSFSHRYMMTKFLKKKFKNIKISRIEDKGKKKKNYTIKTLRWMKKRYLGYDIYLLIGSDMLLSFRTWSRYRRILPLVTLVVATREGDEENLEEMKKSLEKEGAKVVLMPFTPVNISSSEIRKALKENLPINNFLDREIMEYIKEYRLYTV